MYPRAVARLKEILERSYKVSAQHHVQIDHIILGVAHDTREIRHRKDLAEHFLYMLQEIEKNPRKEHLALFMLGFILCGMLLLGDINQDDMYEIMELDEAANS